jgi:hypothetical protein
MEQGEQPATTTDESSAFDFMLSGAEPPDDALPPVEGDREPSHGILTLGVQVPEPEPTRSPLDWIALVLAIVVAPLGLVAGIVASVLSVRRHGYVSGLARSAIVVSVVLCLALTGGGVAYSFYAKGQAHEAALRASSAPMCKLIAEKPRILSDAAFGWPALGTTIPAYVDAVTAYEKWWTSLAKVAPKPVASQVVAIEKAAQDASSRIAVSKVIDHDQDYADLQKVASASTLPKWVGTYCE